MTEKIEIYQGFDLNYVKINKFRTIKLVVSFARKYRKEDRLLSMLLSRIILESSQKYKSREEIGKQAEENYNQEQDRSTSFWGKNLELTFSTTFLDGKYINSEHNKKCIDLFFEILYNPNIIDGAFEEASFKVAKNNLKSKIKKLKENPMNYAVNRVMKLAGYEVILEEEMEEELNKITPKMLYEYYLDVIKNDYLEVSMIGDINDELLEYVKNKINDRVNGKINDLVFEKEVVYQEVEEESKNKQTNLVMLFKMKNLTKKEREVVMSLYNDILGDSPCSKLFVNVREKNSLCYSVKSSVSGSFSYLKITAGINSKDIEKAKKIILDQIENIKLGKITKKELAIAISTSLESLQTYEDSQSKILNKFLYRKHRDAYTHDEFVEITKKITKEDIVDFSKKLVLDTVYVLKGDVEW